MFEVICSDADDNNLSDLRILLARLEVAHTVILDLFAAPPVFHTEK